MKYNNINHDSKLRSPTSRTHPWNIVVSMTNQTLENVGNTITSTVQSAQQAFREQQQSSRRATTAYSYPYSAGRTGRNNSSSRSRRTTALPHNTAQEDEFDLQFGLSDLRPATIVEEEHHQIDEEMPLTQQACQTNGISTSTTTTTSTARPLKGYPFVVLKDVPQRTQLLREQETWGIPSNLDLFLTRVYRYYYHRGIIPMTCQFVVEISSLLFTLWLSRILLKNVDWSSLVKCKDESTCYPHWSDYYYSNENNNNNNNTLSWTAYLLIQGYTILILLYAMFQIWSFYHALIHATTCKTILHDKLGLSQRKLQNGALPWNDVVQALATSQESGSYRIVLNSNNNQNDNTNNNNDNDAETTSNGSNQPQTQQPTSSTPSQALSPLDPLTVSQRIMRKDNFLIAFFNQNLLDVSVGGRQYWCSSLEWSIYTCVLNFMFNHKYELRPSFCLDSSSLSRRLQVCGVVHLILLPFGILFVSVYFLLRNVYDFKTTRQYMGHQQWSSIAYWTFREFNELPHMLEQRLEPSYIPATKYVGLFGTSEWIAAIGKLLVYLGGAVGGVLLFLGVLNDAILLHVQLWDRNLLWYAGMAGIVYSVGKALLPTKEATPSVTRNLFGDMDTSLKNVAQYTHYYPEHWKGRGWDANVYKSFKRFYDTKVKLFLFELAALILAPYILFFKLSKCAPAICEFCLVSKARMAAGTGDICGFSTFDFDTFGDEAWEGRTLGKSAMLQKESPTGGESLSESIMRMGNLEDATRIHAKPKAREGKMEKSFFTFQAAYPDWRCSASGQSLVDRVEEYRLASISRERELHIEAAARQLQTLARLEQQITSPRTNQQRFEALHLRDGHYGGGGGSTYVPPADAGAGISQTPQRNDDRGMHMDRSFTQNQTSPPSMPSLHYRASPTHSQFQSSSRSDQNSQNILSEDMNRPQSDPLQHPATSQTLNPQSIPSSQQHTNNSDLAAGSAQRTELSIELSRLFFSQSAMFDDAGLQSQPIGTTMLKRMYHLTHVMLEDNIIGWNGSMNIWNDNKNRNDNYKATVLLLVVTLIRLLLMTVMKYL